MKRKYIIIRLNRADYISLCGGLLSLVAIIIALGHHLYLAISCLYLAMLADALDGIIARKYRITRSFGRYLDGFMDQLIYLTGPSIVLYQSGYHSGYAVFIALMILCGCIRLAVFNEVGNLEGKDDKLSYLGMPVFWSIFIVSAYMLLKLFSQGWLPDVLMSLVLMIFSFSMLSVRSFYKFRNIPVIFCIALAGCAIFLLIHFTV